jgi:DNA polymerase
MDFETYSEAGYRWDDYARKWRNITKNKGGISVVGASVYSEHPSAEGLCLGYDLCDGVGVRLWAYGLPNPQELFNYLAKGGLIEAANSAFEYYIWNNVMVPKCGWPPLLYEQLRDVYAAARAWAVPGSLKEAGKVLNLKEQKDKKGDLLIRKLSIPRSPTKADESLRATPDRYPKEFRDFYQYCIQDVKAEMELAANVPPLSPVEEQLWLLDQKINYRGVHIDTESLEACIRMINQAEHMYTEELQSITHGEIMTGSEVSKMLKWVNARGLSMGSMDEETITETLEHPNLSYDCKRILKLRQALASQSIKKLFTIQRTLSRDGRLRNLFVYCGADRTGRFAGRGPQPQNLPSKAPKNVEETISDIKTLSVEALEDKYGGVYNIVGRCLRSLFVAAPGKELICSDYSAIEAVVLAELAGESWRQEVFRSHGKIYEMSASRISGVPFEDFITCKGEHPLRKQLGKVAELASGYGGGVAAWKVFGADKFMTDDQIQMRVKQWRNDSPMIVKFWHELERAAKRALKSPGTTPTYRYISYTYTGGVLYCTLPSGRHLAYHQPLITPKELPWGAMGEEISYMGWNTDPKKGPRGWIRLRTWGGKLVENVTQAVARDILTHAMPLIENAGYHIVLHVHDEVVSEVPIGYGSIKEFEQLMGTLPTWAADWPVRASGGWRGHRYRGKS